MSTDNEGHCRHCDPERLDCHYAGDDIGWVHASPVDAVQQSKSQWVSGHCPMCAEAERIAAWLRRQHGVEIYRTTEGEMSMRLIPPSHHADAIVRGET